jgi:hypothetical protein
MKKIKERIDIIQRKNLEMKKIIRVKPLKKDQKVEIKI